MIIGLGLGLGLAGRSGGGAAFDFADLGWTTYLIDYPGSPTWPQSASAGTSGVNGDPTDASDAPSAGTLNGHGTAVFNGTTHVLSTPDDMSVYVDANTFTILALVKGLTPAAAGANPRNDRGILSDLERLNVGWVDDGGTAKLSGSYYDGSGFVEPARVAMAAGSFSLAMARLTAGAPNTFEIGVNGAWLAQATGGALSFSAGAKLNLAVGNLSSPQRCNVEVAGLWIADDTKSDGNITQVRTRIQTVFGVSV